MRIAIVHEWMVNFRGSERVVLELARMFPDADIYASVVDKSQLPKELADREIRTTMLQKFPFSKRHYQKYLPFMPFAYERLDLSGYDLIISSSHCCAKGVIAPPGSTHVCYCYTPMRYAWSGYEEYRNSLRSPLLRVLMGLVMSWLRRWDFNSSSRVDHFIACSHEVQERIHKYYQRDSSVIFPPVARVNSTIPALENVNQEIRNAIATLDGEPFYLSLGRLVSYKRVDLAVEACSQLGRWLVVAGAGPELQELRKRAGDRAIFIENFTDEEAAFLYAHGRAFLFPGREDFGITVVEAQAHGLPVIAFGEGGARDTVLDGETGLLFESQTVHGLVQAILAFEEMKYDASVIMSHAKHFLPDVFRTRFFEALDLQHAL